MKHENEEKVRGSTRPLLSTSTNTYHNASEAIEKQILKNKNNNPYLDKITLINEDCDLFDPERFICIMIFSDLIQVNQGGIWGQLGD